MEGEKKKKRKDERRRKTVDEIVKGRENRCKDLNTREGDERQEGKALREKGRTGESGVKRILCGRERERIMGRTIGQEEEGEKQLTERRYRRRQRNQ